MWHQNYLGSFFKAKGSTSAHCALGLSPSCHYLDALDVVTFPQKWGGCKTDSPYWDTLDNEWGWEVGQLLMIAPCQKANGAEGNPQQRA